MKAKFEALIALFVFAAFLWLASYSRHYHTQSANDFVQQKLAEYDADRLMDIYNIKAEEIAKPVDLFAENGKRI